MKQRIKKLFSSSLREDWILSDLKFPFLSLPQFLLKELFQLYKVRKLASHTFAFLREAFDMGKFSRKSKEILGTVSKELVEFDTDV